MPRLNSEEISRKALRSKRGSEKVTDFLQFSSMSPWKTYEKMAKGTGPWESRVRSLSGS